MLIYEKDGMKLKFLIEDDEVKLIEYATTALDVHAAAITNKERINLASAKYRNLLFFF